MSSIRKAVLPGWFAQLVGEFETNDGEREERFARRLFSVVAGTWTLLCGGRLRVFELSDVSFSSPGGGRLAIVLCESDRLDLATKTFLWQRRRCEWPCEPLCLSDEASEYEEDDSLLRERSL